LFDFVGGRAIKVPAYQNAKLVDPTGAGDVFCGGFLGTIVRGFDQLRATVRGVTAASFVIEELGGLHLLDLPARHFAEREKTVMNNIEVRSWHE
jgi:ribokinase